MPLLWLAIKLTFCLERNKLSSFSGFALVCLMLIVWAAVMITLVVVL